MSISLCALPLSHPPSATQLGIGHHGPGIQSFCLADRWALHLYTYHARITVRSTTFEIVPGSIGLTPMGERTTYDFPHSHCTHTYAHFRLPIATATTVQMPLMQVVGTRFEHINHALIEAVGWFPTVPERANARLWDILWQLTTTESGQQNVHRAIERARHYIERNLARPMTVPAIAKYAGCSPTYLARLFQEHVDMTIVAFIRSRRAERAAYLLRHSTVPIKIIPHQIGIADVQSLNKMVRRELGRSPREIRHGV